MVPRIKFPLSDFSRSNFHFPQLFLYIIPPARAPFAALLAPQKKIPAILPKNARLFSLKFADFKKLLCSNAAEQQNIHGRSLCMPIA